MVLGRGIGDPTTILALDVLSRLRQKKYLRHCL